MALKKDIKKENGIVCNYHRISNLNLDVDNKCVHVKIKSYINKEMRDKEKRYLELQNIILDKEKKIILQEITDQDKEYLLAKSEIETIPSNTVIEIKEYILEVNVNVDTTLKIADIYNMLKTSHGIFMDSLDI